MLRIPFQDRIGREVVGLEPREGSLDVLPEGLGLGITRELGLDGFVLHPRYRSPAVGV